MIDVTFHGRPPAGVAPSLVRKAFRETFRATRRPERGSVSLAFVSDGQIRTLNRQWRKKDKPTDVLSFAPVALPGSSRDTHNWGDIFVAPTTVRKEAKRRGIAFPEECLRVSIHGLLHLMGYDHPTDAEEFRMFSIQERALARTLSSV